MQWCFPLRRQQAGVTSVVTAKARGATKLQASAPITRLARTRRIVISET